jgi:quercetin dioxygenase-like cupin family protein
MNAPVVACQHVAWEAIAAETPADGIERRMMVGQQLMACRLHFAPHVVTPIHRHPHEQLTLVLQGRVRFTIEGVERVAAAGDVLHFPSNAEHGATMLDQDVVLVDIFTPLREDFLART